MSLPLDPPYLAAPALPEVLPPRKARGRTLLFSFVYVLVNLIVDLLYSVLDPRIRQ